MACFWLVPLVISVLGLVCRCEYINVTVSHTNATWENTKLVSGCKLVGLDRNRKLNPADIRVLNHTGPLDAWIGAQVQLSPWINITGCFLHDNSSVSRTEVYSVDISNVRSPVETCFDQCSSEEFAITATRCYCLHDVTSIRGKPCLGHTCGSRNNSLCGHNNQCMCRYKQLSTDPVLNKTGNCMTIRKISNNYIYTPENCSFGHTFVCTYTNKSKITVYDTNSIGSWTDALSLCHHNNQMLLGLNTENIPKHNNKLQSIFSYWIGMFRFHHFNWGGFNVNNGQCVSIHIMPNAATSPELRLRNCSTTLPVICGQKSDVSTLSSSSPTSNGVPLPPIIGTVAGLVIIVLITSVVCLINRRKRQNELNNNRTTEQRTESWHCAQVAIDAHSHIDAHHNMSYSELSKNNGDPIQAEGDYIYNHLHSADRENERVKDLYHHTTDFRSEYDSLEKFNHGKDDQTDSEYDHIKVNSKLPS
ncbi:hypothetical protein KP79_PYT01788 [Mizuhopecten yessoensis]|uniref:C-type lectin domain-containing protein n=1 Tax=Mizuhopecten yessoensis TaxID=6573 RepID=A0A210Q5H1_MIZYE|nr:hypothetical protein KP79_PYT01788 [Mizuhopecten yessoensis]